MLNVIKNSQHLACFDIRSLRNVLHVYKCSIVYSYSLSMGNSFILAHVLTVFSMFFHLCCNFYYRS